MKKMTLGMPHAFSSNNSTKQRMFGVFHNECAHGCKFKERIGRAFMSKFPVYDDKVGSDSRHSQLPFISFTYFVYKS